MKYLLAHSALVLALVSGIIILIAALHDIAFRTVPNSLAFAVTVLGLARGISGEGIVGSLLAAGGVFVLAAMCWRFGWLGGGDAKLLAAASLTMPAAAVPSFIAGVALAGGALALVYLATRTFLSCSPSKRPAGFVVRLVRVEHWRLSRGGPLPYACAIAGGYLSAAY